MTDKTKDHKLNIYYYLNAVECEHPRKRFIWILFNYFIITGPHGQHICLIYKSLETSASELLEWIPENAVTLEDIKVCIPTVTGGITSYMLLLVWSTRVYVIFQSHEATLTGIDLQLKNLRLPTPRPETLSHFEEEEIRMPSAQKILQDRTIYQSSRIPPGDSLPTSQWC